ncbi:peroxiredoxin family protein [Kaarinaea lacus]
MFFCNSAYTENVRYLAGIIFLCSSLWSCDNGDLFPSGEDRREPVVAGSEGYLPGQVAANFSLADSTGTTVNLYDYLLNGATPADAIVLYFTMWCPICLGHSDHMIYALMPQFSTRGKVKYFLIDYVSGSVQQAFNAELANGYVGSDFVVLADTNRSVFRQFHAAMGTTVVIDASGVIRMNEDYRTGDNLAEVLDSVLQK